MLSAQIERVPVEKPQPSLEPLENGDALHARAFLRRYEAMPRVKKAELIEGIVYMGSPVRIIHSKPDNLIQTWLGTYAVHTPGTECLTNATVHLDADNVYQPDALLRLLPERGGQTSVNADGYLLGPPELIVEVAASSASIDLRDKLRVYRRCGVKEYLVWRVVERRFDWLSLQGDDYQPLAPDASGILRSQVFPGLDLPGESLLALDGAKVLATLEAGLASSAHGAFLKG